MEPLLAIKSLSRRFGGLVAVDVVDINIGAGEVHGLIGPNGAGKTTVLNVVSGHLAASSGKLLFEGRDITRLAPERRAGLGIRRTFQNLKLFREMTALDNVKIGLHAETRSDIFHSLLRTRPQQAEEEDIERRARAALDFVGLLSSAEVPGGSLPYGHQRLLEIARAVVARPKLLLLDEPAAGLNGAEAAKLVDLIRRIRANGVTIMLVEHHMEVVMPTCDRITVLNHGRHLAEGPPAEIRKHPEVITAYLGKRDAKRPRTQPSQAARTAEAAHAPS